ncbi:hypothetical protein [Micromonospora sp. NBC_01412]|uniref:hypothetical protein n=1 Tax=Micromonospora sp. NBC_01412 TaxID=2903590 RepID=UPI00324FAE8D
MRSGSLRGAGAARLRVPLAAAGRGPATTQAILNPDRYDPLRPHHPAPAVRRRAALAGTAGLAEAGQKLDEAQAKITPELRAKAAALLGEASRGRMAS